jgi:hypothetical protein
VLFAFAYAIAANLPFWTAELLLHLLPLGWFCLEFAAIGLLALFLPRAIVAALLLVTAAADLLSAISKTYYLSPTECLANFGGLRDFPAPRLFAVALVLALVFSVAAIPFFLPARVLTARSRFRAALCLLGFGIAAVVSDYIAIVRDSHQLFIALNLSRPSDVNRFTNLAHLWAGRYPILRLYREHRFGRASIGGLYSVSSLTDMPPIQGAVPIALAASGLLSPKPPAPQPNLVLILVESWGIEQNASVREAMTASYTQPALLARYRVLEGEVPFVGSTVGGETRELCGSTTGPLIVGVSAPGLARCLPNQLKALGYHVIALHGMDGHLFDRQTWWNTIGFQETWFRDRFLQQSMPDCSGAFVGTCDAAVAQSIAKRLEADDRSPNLVYWVTLDSHLPVPVPTGLSHPVSCSINPIVAGDGPLCSWYQLIANLHANVAQLAMSKLARPTVFVMVGDHAPPFASEDLRGQFVPGHVPYVILLPR